MKPIFITGYMASGKTTFGRALARKLDCEFIDLDFYIEQRFRKKISEIFQDSGEDRFREMEYNMLREIGEWENVVIACGGGTPCFFDNADFMNHAGTTVFIDTDIDVIVKRLLIAKNRRPLLDGLPEEEMRKKVASHLQERRPYYSKAAITFVGNHLENKREITESVERFLPLLQQKNG